MATAALGAASLFILAAAADAAEIKVLSTGIADEIKPKLKQTPTGVFVGSIIANGEAEIGFQQVSELSHFTGVDSVGPLPADVQRFTMFSSGITAGAKEADAAKALVKFITSPTAAAAFKKRGMEPG